MKFSIIIPVYNAAAYLHECLESVVRPGVEVIAVDDGSTDGSADILAARPGVTVLRQGHTGAWAARNAGLERARGEWLLFVDADDVLAEGWQVVVEEMISRYPASDMVGFSRSEHLPLKTCRPEAVRRVDVSRTIGEEQLDDVFCQYAYRRSAVGDLRFRAFLLGEDKVYQAGALARVGSYVRSASVVYGYRQHAASTVHQAWNARSFESEVRWRALWLATILESGKAMSQRGMRRLGLVALEYHPYYLRHVTDDDLRRRMTEQWLDSLAELSAFPFAAYQRFVMWLLSALRSRLLVACFCWLPFDLKRRLRRRTIA